MSEKRKINTPPVIRVFLSSTFADMEHERSYFGEVLAPRISRICSERGVSFFNVDLRWGITEEDQIGGQVLPICLGEIDKCRPYFIGIIGNRYGSVMERVPEQVVRSIPWLEGKEGVSITELEMLYAVLDHEKLDSSVNSAFYIRSDRLSRELYPALSVESGKAIERLDRLKSAIRSDGGVLCSDYDTIEEFGEKVMRDLIGWLDENFPESGDVARIRREWYNGEILRGHIENREFNAFLDSYIGSSRRSLLIYGDGARGKTASLTAWEPKNAKKILINCASDEAYRDMSAVAVRILSEVCNYLSEEDARELCAIVDGINKDCGGRISNEAERERFLDSVLECIRALTPMCPVAVVINDLNLLSDDAGSLLSRLPVDGGEGVNFICSTNDDEMVENADVIGWNVKEMPLFPEEHARELIDQSLSRYGKSLSPKQFEMLLSSSAARYPGQLRFVISFLLNHGRFNNLDRLTSDIAAIPEVHGIYRYVYYYLTADVAGNERAATRAVLGFLRAADIALSENDCFEMTSDGLGLSKIEWAQACRIFEQFDLIHGDYWYIRDEETEKFVDELMDADDMKFINERLGVHFWEKLCDEVAKGKDASERESAAYAKACLSCFRAAGSYENLRLALTDIRTSYVLIGRDSAALRSAWLELLISTDTDIAAELVGLATEAATLSKRFAADVCRIIHTLDLFAAHARACEKLGFDKGTTVDVVRWMNKITDDGIKIYNSLFDLQKARDFRKLCDVATAILGWEDHGLNETELCKVYFFKCDAEEHLGSYEDSLASANEYFTLALRAGLVEDMQQALRMRASALYRLGRADEALSIMQRTSRMAYSAGRTRDYLSTLNMTAMCYYRQERYEDSIEIFDRLCGYWRKLGDVGELCNTMLNKGNAFHLSGKTDEAFSMTEEFYESVKDDDSMRPIIAAFCGNLGLYAFKLERYDTAEAYLLKAIALGKRLGAESTLANAYDTLGKLYKKTDSFKKGIALYAEQMEFHWKRREYEKVIDAYKSSFEWLSSSNHKKQALELEAEWKSRFSQIEGGLDYFDSKVERRAADALSTDRLLERAKLAASAGDLRGEADAYLALSDLCKKEGYTKAAQYIIKAATLYDRLGDGDAKRDVLEVAMKMLFHGGQIEDIPTLDTVIAVACDEAFGEIAGVWRRLGDLAYAARMEDEGEILSEGKGDAESLASLVEELLRCREKNEYLTVCCIFDLAAYLVRALPHDTILSLVSAVSDNYRQDIIDRFDSKMSNQLNEDLNYLMNTYYGKRADRLIERYEKYVRVLDALEGANAPAIAGNLALIFRRRKEKEKAFYYHNLSAEIFRRVGKIEDYFIEMMNGATARKELSSVGDAIEMYRAGLREASEQSNRKFAAMIAGNLASTLMSEMHDEDRAEIESCFAIEEQYFRESGYARDLVVSLVHQSIYYVKTSAPIESWKGKIAEARSVAKEAKLAEFESVISQLEWHAAQADREEIGDDAARDGICRVFTENGYKVLSFQREESYYYVITKPEKDEELFDNVVHAAMPFGTDCCLRVIALTSPVMYPSEAENVDRYIEWWNQFNKYTLKWEKEEKRFRAEIVLHASDWSALSDRFAHFRTMWEADKMIFVALKGFADLDTCRQAKLRIIDG